MRAPVVFIAPDPDAPVRPDWPQAGGIALPDEAATDALAKRLAPLLRPGDTLLLSGSLGAGKTHLARALIRAHLQAPGEPVPSPSFTLVQTYSAPDGTEIWHADLYRLGDPGEVAELGLEDAMGSAICLIEWPDRLAPHWPEAAVLLHLDHAADHGRAASLYARPDSPLATRLVPAFAP